MDNENSGDLLLSITDKTGKIIHVNEYFCNIYQYSENEFLGNTHSMLKSGHHPESFYKNLWQTISKGKQFSCLIKNKAKNGNTFWIKSKMIPIFDGHLIPNQYVCVGRIVNISKEKTKSIHKIDEVNRELSDFKTALDNSALVAITDVEGIITYANDMFCKISKYSRSELLGSNHRILKSGHHGVEFYKNMWDTITSGKTWHGDVKNKAKDGTFYWVRTMMMPIFDNDGKIERYISIRTNITAQIELREKLVKSEKLSSIGEFASRMSHDLRNPLSIIQISLENLKLKYGTDDSAEKSFSRVERSIDRMIHQIDNVLDFVRGHTLELIEMNLSEIISESVDLLTIPENIKLILPKNDVDVLADKKLFSVSLNNLILNSIQAIDGTGIIEITCEENDDTTIIQIKDSGVGISKENQNKIFEPLFTTKQQGTGLGLASVKSIIESHGGIISVTSPPTIFTITLQK